MSYAASAFLAVLALLSLSTVSGEAAAPGEAASVVIIGGNSTILSENGTFELGFFSTDGNSTWFLGIRYASISIPTYVWVANRGNLIENLTSATLEISEVGQLAVRESKNSVIWQSDALEPSRKMKLLETGNLVLLSEEDNVVWQSFDFPTDTWLPGMNLTKDRSLVSWRSPSDPSPGFFSFRLKPPEYGEFELVYNASKDYWSTGNWTGDAFTGVPEMTIPYIYRFHFLDPFKPSASFGYMETSLDTSLKPPLTRFQVDPNGLLRQYTWSSQTGIWNSFWSQPDSQCRVYGLCGNLGFCSSINLSLRPCECLSGFVPVDGNGWTFGDYSEGCRRKSDASCAENDEFEELGIVGFEGGAGKSFSGSRSSCEKSCLSNCSCVGFSHNEKTNLCKNIYTSLLNLKNLSSDALLEDMLFVRVQRRQVVKNISKSMVLVASIVGSIAALGLSALMVIILWSRRQRNMGKQENTAEAFPVLLNLRVFTYKELHTATHGFSEKLGHGGFGVVFRGQLPDSIPVAVKRLERHGGAEEFRAERHGGAEKEFQAERHGGAEKEFRAEVRTIARQIVEGNIAAVVDERLGGAYSKDEAERVALVAVWCIQDEEELRPAMGLVVKMLEGVVEIPIPPPPKLIQALVSGESFQGIRGSSGDEGGSSGEKRPESPACLDS
ncbi:hypothetical protein SAY86_011196 [Trapa natans]|uniref:Receptor-like serine/threonine-protein kinase n=1 Tax=Trapa natans TaxID=22666 RepID=A0AAN7LFZ6_TRANT|nr:hypothetical protein SAY86_011196 [Trapa natans]